MTTKRRTSSCNNCPIPRKKEAKIHNLVEILITDEVLLKEWYRFCEKLECSTQKKLKWDRGIKNGTFEYFQVFSEMLDHWVERNSNKVTVNNLCRVFKGIQCVAVAEKLENEFNKDEIIQQFSAKRNVFLQNGKLNWPLKHGLFVPTGNFTGREEQLEEIKTNFESKKNLMLITGFGGIGKTELCRKFAYDIVNYTITSCVWLHGENLGTLRESVLKLANELKITNEGDPTVLEYFEFIASFILEISNRLILVIDNVDVSYPEVLKIIKIIRLAKYEKMFVIVTSRDRNVLEGAGITMQLDILSKLQARRMLQTSMSGLTDSDSDELGELVQYFPLALQQAVAYIKQQRKHFRTPNYSVSDYVNEFEVKRSQMLDHKLNELEHDYTKTTSVTWDMTFSKISEHGVEILKIISYLDPDEVKLRFLEKVCIQMGLVDFDEGLDMLNSYCLVKIEQNQKKYLDTKSHHLTGVIKVESYKRVSVHRLVQEVMRGKVDIEDYIKILFDALFLVIWKLIGRRGERAYLSVDVHLISVFKFAWKCEMRYIHNFNDALFFLIDLGRIDCAEKVTKLEHPHIQFSLEFGVGKREFFEKVLLWSFVCADSRTNSEEIAKGEFHVRWELVSYLHCIRDSDETLEGCLQISQKYFDESSKITLVLKYLLARTLTDRADFDRAFLLCEELATTFPFENDDGQANFLYKTICKILSYPDQEYESCTPSRLSSLIMNKIVKTNPKERMKLEALWCDWKGDYKKALELYTKLVHEGRCYYYKLIELRIMLTDFESTTVEEFVREFGGVNFHYFNLGERDFTLRGLEKMLPIYELNLGSVHELTINLKLAMAQKLCNGNRTEEKERCTEFCDQILGSKFDQKYKDAFWFLCWARNIQEDFDERRKILQNLLYSKRKELGNHHSNTKFVLHLLQKEIEMVSIKFQKTNHPSLK